MARTAAPPAGTTFNNDPSSALRMNCIRIATCCNKLALHVNMAPRNDTVMFFNDCFSLARGIDFAVASNMIPNGAREMPLLLKQVCRLKDESFLAAAILVLMISIKNACQSRWFSDEDSKELCRLTGELQSSFCTSMDFTTQPISSDSTISTIMSRYYPRIKMGNIIARLDIKAGYGTYVHDFQITQELKSSQEQKIMLFVAQTDNIGTSSCLINPTDASFLINGRGVDRRRTNYMDTGPQMPTLVNHYLKCGTNLIQAVGQYNGNYIIVIASMRMASAPDHATLQDYVQPTISKVDTEIIEGPSRISLNCPMSFKRITVPVKGHMCKHLQCIDYKNYMEKNARRPSWRCPQCNQHLCFTDIRVDQNMVKVLKEIGKTVNDVLISSDGSWKPVTEIDDHCNKPREMDAEVSAKPVDLGSPDIPPDVIIDLADDNYMDKKEMSETSDGNIFTSSCQNQAKHQDMAANSLINNTNDVNPNNAVPVEDSFWSGVYLSTHESDVINCHSESQTSAPRNGYGEDTFMPCHASGRPVSVQALPMPNPTTSSLPQIPKHHPVIHNSSLVVPRTPSVSRIGDSASTVASIMEGQQNVKRTNLNPLQQSRESPSRVQQHPVSQTVGHKALSYVSSYKFTPVFPSGNHNSSQESIPNTRENINQSSSLMRPLATSSQPQTYQGGSPAAIVSSQPARELVAAHRVGRNSRVSLASKTSPYARNHDRHGASMVGGQRIHMPPSPPPAEADVPTGMTAELNSQPSVGRMRGSLTGRAHSDASNYYIIRPTQQPQATTQEAQTSSQPAQAIHSDRTHASTQQAKSITEQSPVSIADLLSRSASSRLEVRMANRAALAQAGIYTDGLFGWPSDQN